MQIWLDQVRDEPFSWDETEKVGPAALERPDVVTLGPVHWRGQVVFADPGFFLRAHLAYEQTLVCTRCLQEFQDPVRSDAELMVLVNDRPGKGVRGEHELHEEDLGIYQLEGEILETAPILLEQLQLNVPMKPLCRADCKGLCGRCGADLNELPDGVCGCEKTAADPRWAALAAFKQGREH